MDWRQACRLAYAMEQNLGELYGRLAEQVSRADLRSLLKTLAGYEDKHKERLLALYRELSGSSPDPAALGEESARAFLEGGWTVPEILDSNRDTLQTEQDVIELAMMIETQALDLYLRWGEQSTPEESKTLYRKLADEERQHLRRLGELSGSAGEHGPGSL
jgi:rubrerythrin